MSTRLSVALADRPHVGPLLAGEIRPARYELIPAHTGPIIGAYRRMVRELAYDVCELAPVTYLMALQAGLPIHGIPVFLDRRFHHGDLSCAPGSGIRAPHDLEGRRVGVRAYSVTTGVWVRGVLAEEHGVDLDSITWIVDDEDHLRVPPRANIERVTDDSSLQELLRSSRIDAAFAGNAGTGRAGPPRAGWEGAAPAGQATAGNDEPYRLFEDPHAAAIQHHRRTGIYPLHAVVAIRAELVARDPELPTSLYRAFVESKRAHAAGDPDWDSIPHLRDQRRMLGGDPLPFGIRPNLPSLEALVRFAQNQGLLNQGRRGEGRRGEGLRAQGLPGEGLPARLFAPGDYPPA